jgi:mannosyltransferase
LGAVSSVAAPTTALTRVRARSLGMPVAILVLAGLAGLSLLLRTRALRAGFWIDEGLSVGIASFPLDEIPGLLRLDGSPPLYYLLLHVWMSVFGSGEGATHGLSVVFAVLTVPAAFWAGRTLGGARSGWMAAVVAGCHPFLTFFAQETRMYALLALVALVFAAVLAHAFALRDRRFLPAVVVVGALLAYTHNWGLFLLGGGILALGATGWRRRDERGSLVRDAVVAYAGIGLLYLPWVPTLLDQAAHTGAPWSARPGLQAVVAAVFTTLGGGGSGPLLLVVGGVGVAVLLARPLPLPGTATELPGVVRVRRARVVELLLALLVGALLLAWLSSQLSPAWASRYLAVFVGPAILLAGIGLAHAQRLGLVALLMLAFLWADDRAGPLERKSNVRDVANRIELRAVRPGDLVVSTHPEQVPVLRYYLGDEFRYASSMGAVADPRVMDWRDALERLEAAKPRATSRAVLASLRPGQAVVLVQPILRPDSWRAPWTELVRERVVQWERLLDGDPRLRRLETFPRFGLKAPPRGVRAVLYRVRERGAV